MILSTVLLVGFAVVFLAHKVTRDKSGKSPFGSPSKWPPNQLPTKREVGAYFCFKRNELGKNYNSRDISKKFFYDSILCIRKFVHLISPSNVIKCKTSTRLVFKKRLSATHFFL